MATGRLEQLAVRWCNAEASQRTHPRGVFRDRVEVFVCTLPYGHDGYHVGEDAYGQIAACWHGEWAHNELAECICGGGEQGEGLVSIPHESHCPLYQS